MADTLNDAPFIPQTVTPPEKPLGMVHGLLQMIANPLYVWPRAMYENPYHGVRWIGRTFHYFRKPEHMKAVFLDHPDIFRKSQFQKKLVGPALGEGLLTSEGEHWKFQRRAASPAFRIDKLRALAPAFASSAEATVERMKAKAKAGPIDVMAEMQHATLDVIVETILGGADPNFGFDRIATTVEDYIQTMGKPDMLDMFGTPEWVPRPWGGKGRKAAEGLKQSAVNAIDRRRASGETRNDLLGLLLAARDPETGKGLSDDELRDNVVTFIGAGHETTALTLTFSLYLIANAPEIQERLLREALDVCGDKPVDAAMIDAMPFHEQVIKEAMRLYPPVAIIDRVAQSDIDLGDVQVKKGDFAFALIYIMHRHKMLWEHPERFDPDRFSEERAKSIPRFQYMPFGAGPRICIGMKFAYMEAISILATLVRELRFLPNPNHTVEPNIRITLRPERGMPLFVEAR
ncbi:MAG TPA: cytochrome P450 [Hyphomonadaceae bacterium]|nr:cytochrome P450 [Hyphomonadaceae bacterium]HPN04865.1 cytochrome P450 [Hyphomonadaceae bacterium]